MERKEFTIKCLSGMFFLIGIFLIIATILVLGSNRGITKSKFQVSVLYRNVGGLLEGAPVLLAGVNVGHVDQIDFLDKEVQGRRVIVTLNIFSRYKKQLEKSTDFFIKTEGILGEKLIEIEISEGAPLLDFSQPIIGEDPLDVQDLAEVFTKAAESFTKTSNQLSQVDIVELTQVMEESSRALLMTAGGINSIMDELQSIMVKAKRILDRLEQKTIEGNLFKLF